MKLVWNTDAVIKWHRLYPIKPCFFKWIYLLFDNAMYIRHYFLLNCPFDLKRLPFLGLWTVGTTQTLRIPVFDCRAFHFGLTELCTPCRFSFQLRLTTTAVETLKKEPHARTGDDCKLVSKTKSKLKSAHFFSFYF